MKSYQVYVILALITVAALLAAGCGQPAELNSPSTEEQITEPVDSVEESPIPVGPENTELPTEIAELIAKSEGVTSYEYTYKTSENTQESSNQYVKGDKLRIKYGAMRSYNKFSYYDVYVDKANGLAYLVCQDTVACKGKKGKEVMYAEFNVDTPLEVLTGVDNGVKVDETEVGNKKAMTVSYTNPEGDSEKIWLWTFKGMPLKREIIRGDQKIVINYDNMVVSPQTETSVELPSDLEMM